MQIHNYNIIVADERESISNANMHRAALIIRKMGKQFRVIKNRYGPPGSFHKIAELNNFINSL